MNKEEKEEERDMTKNEPFLLTTNKENSSHQCFIIKKNKDSIINRKLQENLIIPKKTNNPFSSIH